jgi:hypothetical protein
MPRQHEPSRRFFWPSFLEELATDIGRDAVVNYRKQVVTWRDGNHVNHLGLLKWVWPTAQFPDAPRITRISLNKHVFGQSESVSVLRRLGFARQSAPSPTPGLWLEWSVLGNEVLDFASWLPLWMRGQLDPSVTIPLPPHPSHVWGQGLRATDYAWTVTAFHARARFHDQEPWLHPLAIPAQELTPAVATMIPGESS